MTEAAEKVIPISRLPLEKGKLEFWMVDPMDKQKPPKSHIVIYGHPEHTSEEQWRKYLNQVVCIIPSFMDMFDGRVLVKLVCLYEVNSMPRQTTFSAEYSRDQMQGLADFMYADLIAPTVSAAKVPNEPL